MKALILTVSAGEGHNAIAGRLTCLEGRAEVEVFDLFKEEESQAPEQG